jgi:HAD superfamily hydrolase (TIGR01549 family)
MVKVVCFDTGGTLLETQTSGFCTRLIGSLGYSIDEVRPLLEKYFFTTKASMDESLREFCNVLNIPLASVDYDVLMVIRNNRIYEDVLLTLERLLKRYRMAILSNSTPWESVDLHELGVDDFMEAIFYSFEIGVAKPHLEAFKAVERALNVEPESVIMVGDSNIDIAGARNAGWKSIYINRNGKSLSEQADATITTFLDLPDLISQL